MSAPTSALVRAELTKVSSTRLWWGLLLGGVLFVGISAGFTAAFAGVEVGAGAPSSPGLDDPGTIRQVYAGSAFGGMYIFALILGIVGMTGEYRYQTITPTFLVSPRRHRVVVAKMIAHAAIGLVLGAAAVVTAFAVGAVVITVRGSALGLDADGLLQAVALAVVAVAIWTLMGVGIGTLITNQILAIVLAILITFLIEPLLSALLGALDADAVVGYLPTNASSALVSPSQTVVDLLTWWQGGLVLLAYAVVFAVAGVLASISRDVT